MDDTSNGTFNRCTFVGNLFSCLDYLLPGGGNPQIGCSKTQYKTRSLFEPLCRTLINKGASLTGGSRKTGGVAVALFTLPQFSLLPMGTGNSSDLSFTVSSDGEVFQSQCVLPFFPALDGTYILSDLMLFSGLECSLTSIPGIGINLINSLPLFILKVALSSSGDCRVLPPSSLFFLATMVSCSKRKCSCKTLKAC